MKTILIILSLLLIPVQLFAANDYHIISGGTGDRSGDDWNNADSNITPTFVRGNIYYIASGYYQGVTSTAAADGFSFDTAESGTDWIYIKKATDDAHGSDTGWVNATMGVNQAILAASATKLLDFSTGYWSIDGVTGGGPGSWTTGFGIKVSLTTAYIRSNTVNLVRPDYGAGKLADNFEFKHIDFTGAGTGLSTNDDMFYANATGGDKLGTHYLTLSYNYFHNANRTLILTRNVRYWLVEYNSFADNYSGVAHGEGWSDGGSDDVIVRYNKFRDNYGTGVIVMKDNKAEWKYDNWQIYGNVFYHKDGFSEGNVAQGVVCIPAATPSGVHDLLFYNNTIYNITYFSGTGALDSGVSLDDPDSSNCVVQNNIWHTTSLAEGATGAGHLNGISVTSHNWYYNTSKYDDPGTNRDAYWAGRDDSNGEAGTSDIFTDSSTYDFTLSESTNAGGTLIPTYATQTWNYDILGNLRGDDGVWDRGAYEFVTGTTTTTTIPVVVFIGNSIGEYK